MLCARVLLWYWRPTHGGFNADTAQCAVQVKLPDSECGEAPAAAPAVVVSLTFPDKNLHELSTADQAQLETSVCDAATTQAAQVRSAIAICDHLSPRSY